MFRRFVLPLGFSALVLTVFLVGRFSSFGDFDAVENLFGELSDSAFTLPITCGIFLIGAYLGLPQFALYASSIIAFGPVQGASYAWLATLGSGTATFWTGRWVGAEAVEAYGGERVARVSHFLGRNAFAASAIIRNLPTAPFIIVNMVFGASKARFLAFLAGLALGSLPKLLLVVFAHESISAAGRGQGWMAVLLGGGVLALWGVIAFWMRTRR